MERWLKKGTLKRSSQEPEYFAVNSSHIDNHSNNENDTNEITPKYFKKCRKYDESYISLGFMNNNDNPQCVICSKVLPNSSMAPAKMRRHLESVHGELKEKNVEFFIRKRDELLKSINCMIQTTKTVNEKATEASYLVSYQIAQRGEAYTIAESLIKPCAMEMVKCMLDEKSAKEISKIPILIDNRINDLAADIQNELVFRLKSCKFALQMDESTDVAGLTILIVIVRYQHESTLLEDLLLCKSLPTRTTGAEIFDLLNSFLEGNEIPWENCVDICTDGAKAMSGIINGAVQRIKNIAKNCSSSHCMIHRQALAAKKLSVSFKKALDEVVKIINFIKSRPLQNRLFKILCEDMGSVHTSLLLHTEVRWLFRGKILTRIFELRDEVRAFFLEHNFELKDRFLDQMWLLKVAYLSDIFTKINELNFTLQGRHVNVFTAHEKIHAFKKKLDFWKICMSSNKFDCFPTIKCFSKEEEVKINEVFIEEIIQHLTGLSEGFNQYFPNDQQVKYKNELWIKNPFIVNTRPPAMSAKEYETFIEFTSDSSLQEKFKSMQLAEFWCSSKDEYPQLSQKAVLVLLPFATTYMCETGFSTYVSTKTKYRNRLDAEPNMLLQLSSIKPNIKNICNNKN
ncbi:zinc finger BED domain-containing protein 5-like [Aphis gossypii]|uniref:zinc finger BED domain-containing protein 5-like n=1 Tax=Aphis gossypii TaxID=80765 RepID=UPI002159505E|nr:zinc finger BED domain-containing protein 5-like [Aphis gossypii]